VIHDSWRIYKLILAHFFRYTLSSIVSFFVDSGMVYLLTVLLPLADPMLGYCATTGARVVSSLLNFFMNKKLVFKSHVSTGKAMLRYYALAIPQLLVQSLINQGLYTLLGITENQPGLRTLIHILVMTILFIVSFTVQQRWVFAADRKEKEKV
jgi:putative flippase GtrA